MRIRNVFALIANRASRARPLSLARTPRNAAILLVFALSRPVCTGLPNADSEENDPGTVQVTGPVIPLSRGSFRGYCPRKECQAIENTPKKGKTRTGPGKQTPVRHLRRTNFGQSPINRVILTKS